MKKIISLDAAVSHVKDGATILVGGFLGVGTPEALVDALVAKNVKNLTLVCNDTGRETLGVGKLVVNKQFKKIMASHIGTNKETGRQMNEGETEVELIPQGTLAERIRAGGYGLGGVLTPTGVGTKVQEGKQVIEVDGKSYLLEKPIRGDVALLFAHKADKYGNLKMYATARNFNTVMASAADVTVVLALEVVDVLDPNEVDVPGVFVNYVVDGGAL